MSYLPTELVTLITSYFNDLDVIKSLPPRLLNIAKRTVQQVVMPTASRATIFGFPGQMAAERFDIMVQLQGLQVIRGKVYPADVADLIDLARLPTLRKCHIGAVDLPSDMNISQIAATFWQQYLHGRQCVSGKRTNRTIKGVDICIGLGNMKVTVQHGVVAAMDLVKIYRTFARDHSLFGIRIDGDLGIETRELLRQAPELHKIQLDNEQPNDNHYFHAVAETANWALDKLKIEVIKDDAKEPPVPTGNLKLLRGMRHTEYLCKMKAAVPFAAAEEVLAKFPNLIVLALTDKIEGWLPHYQQLVTKLLQLHPELRLILVLFDLIDVETIKRLEATGRVRVRKFV